MKKMLLFCCGLALAVAMQAQIIHVPADYSKIQLGINAATPGDTVLVAEGTYYEQINFKGKKPLMVASRFIMDGDTSHISKTIIDGSQLTNMDSASVVYFISGEDTTSILCGFTIRGGKGTIWKSSDLNSFFLEGGGIYIYNASGTVRNNIITANSVDDHYFTGSSGVVGAGIMIEYDSKLQWSIIENNEISGNWVTSFNLNSGGGGISSFGNIRIKNNLIKGNSCIQTSTDPAVYLYGGGLYYGAPENPVSELILQDNIFENNSVIGIDGCGAGVCTNYGKVTCTGNTFTGNEIANSDAYGGGGLLCEFLNEGSVFTNNIFRNNKSAEFGGGMSLNINYNASGILVENNYFIDNVAIKGGAIGTYDVPMKLQNNVFSGNHSEQGGAIYLEKVSYTTFHLATLVNNSFSRNTATYGGAIASTNSKPLIINSVFWGDSADNGREIYLFGNDKVEIANTAIKSSFITGTVINGGSILDTDPMYTDNVLLTTEPYSPCVDAGAADFTCNCGDTFYASSNDITGVPRPAGSGYDIGAYDLKYSGVGIPDIQTRLPLAVWPNPFSATVSFNYTLEESLQVTLHVFDNYGRLVVEPVNAFQLKGEQKVEWNTGSLPDGVYYYRLSAANKLMSGKVVKIK
jgi:predicted outer membrane repeat protein